MLEEADELGLFVQQLGPLHRGDGHQVQGAVQLVLIVQGHGAQHLALLHRGLYLVGEQVDAGLDLVQVQVHRQGAGDRAPGLQVDLVGLAGHGDVHLGHRVVPLGDGHPVEVGEAVVQQPGALYQLALAQVLIALLLHGAGAQHHRHQEGVPVLGGGHQTAARRVGGARLAPDALVVHIAGVIEVGDQTVGVEEEPLVGQVGGGDGVAGRGDDGAEQVVLQGGGHDERQVIGGGVVLLVVDAGGVGEVGALTAQLPGLSVHVGHEVVHRAVRRRGQHIGRVTVGLQQHAVQQLLHRQLLPHLEVGHHIALPRRDVLEAGLADGDHGGGGEPPLLDGLHHQQGGHDLGGAGGVGLLIGVLGVQHLPVVGVQQHRVGAEQVELVLLLGGGGQHQQGEEHGAQQQKRQQAGTIFFHRKISVCMIY